MSARDPAGLHSGNEAECQKKYEEAGIDENGNPYVRTLGWLNTEGVLPSFEFPCQECAQGFNTERALKSHIRYTHGPKEDTDPTNELIKEVILNAGIPVPAGVHTNETIQLCPFLAIHKPQSVNNLNGKKETKYDKEGYRKVRVLFDTGAGESVIPPEEFEEYPVQESEGSRKGWFCEAANGEEIPNEGEK